MEPNAELRAMDERQRAIFRRLARETLQFFREADLRMEEHLRLLKHGPR